MTIRWGMIGTGDVTERKSGPALYQAERSELIAVMNRTKSRAEDYAARHGNPIVCETAEELLANDSIDAVYIATPPDSHAEYTSLSAAAGKHVFCEKPMAMSVDECQQMIDVCKQHDVSLAVAFYRRYFPVVEKMKQLVESGAVGQPLRISATTISRYNWPMDAWRLDQKVGGGGFLMDMGTHRFDLFAHFFGTPKTIRGIARSQSWDLSADDSATVAIEFENGVHGSAIFHWNSPIHRDTLEIVGDAGMLTTDSLSGAGRLTLETKAGTEHWTLPSKPPVHLHLVQRIVNHLLDGEPNPCPGESAMLATRIADEVYNSSRA